MCSRIGLFFLPYSFKYGRLSDVPATSRFRRVPHNLAVSDDIHLPRLVVTDSWRTRNISSYCYSCHIFSFSVSGAFNSFHGYFPSLYLLLLLQSPDEVELFLLRREARMKNLPNNEDIENLGMRNSTSKGCIKIQKNIRCSIKDDVLPSHLWDPVQLHWSSSAKDNKQDKEGGNKLPFWRNCKSFLLLTASTLWIVAVLFTVLSNGDGKYCTFQIKVVNLVGTHQASDYLVQERQEEV